MTISTEDPELSFTEVRSLMNRAQLDAAARADLRHVLHVMYRTHREEYVAQWLPYLYGFPHHFEHIFGWFTDAESLEYAAAYAPFARLGLDFWVGQGGDKSLIDLAERACFGRVAAMVFKESRVGDRAMLACLHSRQLTGLEALYVQHCNLTMTDTFDRLLEAPSLHTLTQLDLSGSTLLDAGAIKLAQCKALEGLQLLRLEGCRIKERGRRALKDAHALRGCTLQFGTSM